MSRYPLVSKVFDALCDAWERSPPIVVFSFQTVTDTAGDGYSQRVHAIDAVISAGARLYVTIDERRHDGPRLTARGPGKWAVEMADGDPVGFAMLASLMDNGAHLYFHSLYGFRAATARNLVRRRQGFCIFDVHGAVPEECALEGQDVETVRLLSRLERELWTSSDRILCVSQAMADHLADKHGLPRHAPLVLPIFLEEEPPAAAPRRDRARPRVIYSGGVSRWQQLPRMLDVIAETRERYDFTILTPSPMRVTADLAQRGISAGALGMTVKSAGHDEIRAEYRDADFGFVLRETSIVNRVACPTKLIEYLTYGLVPIMDSAEVGDFVALGMKYVTLEDFVAGRLPSVSERADIARHNVSVRNTLFEQSNASQRVLRDMLTGADDSGRRLGGASTSSGLRAAE